MGSSSSAPPPDPRIAYAQSEALTAQTDIARKTLDMQTQMMPLQRDAMQFGLDSSKTAFQQSQDDRTYALGQRAKLDAAQKPLLDQALNFNEDTRRAELAGQTSDQITTNYSQAGSQQARGLQREGITPTTGQTQAMQTQAQLSEAKARSYPGEAVSTAAKQEGITARANAVNMLGGSANMAQGLTTTGAQIGAQATNVVNSGAAGINSGLSTAGQIFGQMGKQASSLWDAQAQAKYTSDQAASNSNSEMWGTVIGAVAMVAMSDRRLKKNAQRIGTTVKGVPMYRFQYIGSDDIYIGPMADEVERIIPNAVRDVGGYKAVDYSQI
jgi:hypothetical protein